MTYDDYMIILEKNNLHIHSDNIIYKHGKGNRNRPICNNEIFQDLVVKKMNNVITEKEYDLLGIFIHTLVRIVLNNKKFRFQTDTIRDDIVGSAYLDILSAIDKHLFDPEKGNAYSYFFRLAYVAGIHVLVAENIQKDITSRLMDAAKETYNFDFTNMDNNKNNN